MRAHARRAQPGIPIVGEDPPCGRHNDASVFLTGASRTGRHRKCQQARHAGSKNAGIRDGPRETSLHPLQKCPRRWQLGMRLFGSAPARTTALFGRNACRFCTDDPCATYSLLQQRAEKQDNKLLCDECWLHFPWTSNLRGLRGSLLFLLLVCFCVALCAATILVCLCVPSVRGADTTDGSRRMCMRWSLVCRSCLLLPLPSVCWCCGRAVCVCLLPWIGVCVVRGVRRAVHAWLLPSPHVVCPLCVCLLHLSSPLLLSMSLTVQISSTPLNDHTHDDDVPSAVRPVGACPVLLPIRLCGREWR
ncbi:mucin TcMUC [Trypanosoma cruzi]|uniref:Mucin TcMUC n=1 Tax=Trypanosoma cruzi TaxID=5693 RepID=A0A7J6XNX0_TRYCR|nr:mucin TcMUC [Trypanosoma cruzi]